MKIAAIVAALGLGFVLQGQAEKHPIPRGILVRQLIVTVSDRDG